MCNTCVWKQGIDIMFFLTIVNLYENKIENPFVVAFLQHFIDSVPYLSYVIFVRIKTLYYLLTHWGRVTHICVGILNNISSDNGLSPVRRQAII